MVNASPDPKKKRAKKTNSPKTSAKPKPKTVITKESPRFPVVGIGASAGGLEAFSELLEALPSDLGMAFVFILHLHPGQRSMLPAILKRRTSMRVLEVANRMLVEPDTVYVIPSTRDVRLDGGVLRLIQRRETGRHLPVDAFLTSLAGTMHGRAIGVVLSGTASDGTQGLKAVKAAGGITFAQDSQTALHDGMPRSATVLGYVDHILPPRRIASELARIARRPAASLAAQPEAVIGQESELYDILQLLRKAVGVDFTHYKASTIKRRIARRMATTKVESLKEYAGYLRRTPAELDALHRDILIHVTAFFREPEAYGVLKKKIIPAILTSKAHGEPVRIWVPGCSTGEEVYSLAMVVLECMEDSDNNTPVQIFGTDIGEDAIEKARTGVYPESALAYVPPARRNRFFVKTDRGYRISKFVRELCVFARQDLISDPPFSRIDLISCRNVLIYMDQVLQKRVMAVFYYALRDDGYLLLGKSESLSAFSELFALTGRTGKLYTKKPKAAPPAVEFALTAYERPAPAKFTGRISLLGHLEKEVDSLVWRRYSHAGLVVSKDLRILLFRGDSSRYMEPASGAASLDLLRMVNQQLAIELRTAIHKVKRTGRAVQRSGVRITREGNNYEVSIEIVPLLAEAEREACFLVLFEEAPVARDSSPVRAGRRRRSAEPSGMKRLEKELAATREYLQATIEEQEATNEEMKAATEEVLSSNEELQSTNEELETAKEELQSANEELVTLNEQQGRQNAELGQLSDDLTNVLTGINIPVVIVGSGLDIRRFTPAAERLLNLRPADVGRSITNIRPNYDLPDIGKLISEVVRDLVEVEREFQDFTGRWKLLRMRPYRTSDNRIDGVVMVYFDVHDLKHLMEEERRARNEAAAIVESVNQPLLVLDRDLRVRRANPAFYSFFRTAHGRVEGRFLLEAERGRWDIPGLRKWLHRVAGGKQEGADDLGIDHRFPKIGRKRLVLSTRLIPNDTQAPELILVEIRDVAQLNATLEELSRSEETVRTNERRLRELTASLLHNQEEERRRVSRELHDHLNQQMVLLAVDVEKIEKRALRSNAPEVAASMNALGGRIAAVSDEIRRTAYRLHPAILEHLGLGPALKALASELTEKSKVRIFCRIGELPEIALDVALCLYRVAEESLQNVIAHSRARSATVALTGGPSEIRLSVSDRGEGLSRSADGAGLGIVSMRERARLVGGIFSIVPRRGGGTQIGLRVPLPEKRV